MKCYKQIGASAALLTGLASGLSISTLNPSTAHAAKLDKIDTSTWGKPTTTQSKTVTYVDSTGKILGTGKLTVNTWKGADDRYQYVLDRTIPAGYKLANKSDLSKTPDTLTVVADSSSNAASSDQWIDITANASPAGDGIFLKRLFRKDKTVTYVDSTGKVVGTGTLTIYCYEVQEGSHKYYSLSYWLYKSIPAGYKLLDNSSLGDFPDTLTVVADPSSSVPSSAHFGKKIEQLATSDPSNSSSIQNGGDGNGKSDVADAGHGASGSDTGQPHESGFITNGKASSKVESNGKGSANASGTSNVASKPELAVIKAKTVLYVDENGKKLGIGQISVKSDGTRTIYAVNKTIPAGYALQNTSDLKNYPDKLTLVKSAASTDTSDASVVSYARTADGGDDVESGDADAGKDAKNGGTASITSTDAGKAAESKTVAPATTTTTTSTGSTEGNTSSSLPQTGNSGEETSSAVGAALLMATMTVAGIARKKL